MADFPSREAFRKGEVKGKVAGVRLSIDELVKWAAEARRDENRKAQVALDLAADSLTQIADRLEEEG